MVCLIFHINIIINRKNWRITIKLFFKKKSERTQMPGLPSPLPLFIFVRFLMTPVPPLLNERTF